MAKSKTAMDYTFIFVVSDGGCFSLMYATIRLDSAYKVIDQEVEGGEFITWQEYKELTKPQDVSADAE